MPLAVDLRQTVLVDVILQRDVNVRPQADLDLIGAACLHYSLEGVPVDPVVHPPARRTRKTNLPVGRDGSENDCSTLGGAGPAPTAGPPQRTGWWRAGRVQTLTVYRATAGMEDASRPHQPGAAVFELLNQSKAQADKLRVFPLGVGEMSLKRCNGLALVFVISFKHSHAIEADATLILAWHG